MKTLVIHPEDPTTDILKIIYENTDWTVITNNIVSKRIIKKEIKNHDRIIMLGHGNEYGLFGTKRLIIDSSWVYLLREKYCVSIWCNADIFFLKYGLKGLYTGMIISELEEALMYSINPTLEEIEYSNILFSNFIKENLDNPNILNEIETSYNHDTNPIINFNKKNIYLTK